MIKLIFQTINNKLKTTTMSEREGEIEIVRER